MIDEDGNRVGIKDCTRIKYGGGAIGLLQVESVFVTALTAKSRLIWTTNVGSENAYVPLQGEAGSTLTELTSWEHAIEKIDRLQPST